MYAVIRSGGKQYRVAPGDTVKVERLPGKPGGRSTLTVSPGATRYCLPPLRMTAYMQPPEAARKLPL